MGARSPSAQKPDEKVVQGKKPPPRELHCKLDTTQGGKRVSRVGQAVLTDDELRFRTDRHGTHGADFNLHLAFTELTKVELDASGAILTLTTQEGDSHRLHLGRHAPAWKEIMEALEGTLDLFKIGKRSRVAVVAVLDEELLEALAKDGPALQADDAHDLDVIFVGVEHAADLGRLAGQARRLKRPGGSLWVVHPEKSKQVGPRDIAATGRTLGLVDAETVVMDGGAHVLELRALSGL